MKRTKIDYLTHTWNPFAMKCDPVSPGCSHCWHLAMCERMAKNPNIPDDKRRAYSGEGIPILDSREFLAPQDLKKPARIGVQFMGDLFHPNIHFDLIEMIFREMELNPRHNFLILTKRPEQMRKFVYLYCYKNREEFEALGWENIWLGVSVEDQQTANERIPILLQTPANNRFISAEPLLGPIDLCNLSGSANSYYQCLKPITGSGGSNRARLDWVIAGGESGPYARPCALNWVCKLAGQCEDSRVPFFFKQWGEWMPDFCFENTYWGYQEEEKYKTRSEYNEIFYKTGKKKAGFDVMTKPERNLPEGLEL